jgi:3',5'-cyclic AMP phosphodiesterase CpdA
MAAGFIVFLGATAFAADEYSASGLNFAPGTSGKELNFAWFTQSAAAKPVVQIAKKADQNGEAFPAGKAKSFSGSSAKASATQFNGDDKTIQVSSYADKVTVSGLQDSTDYVYRVGDGKTWSQAYSFSTRDEKSFGFFVVGDPQLGAKSTGPKTLASDAAGWQDTLNKAAAKYAGASFILSLGDEVNDYNKLEAQDAEYAAFFAPQQLRSLPLATVNGNHDFQMGEYYGYHYNQPNLSSRYGTSYGNDGDYWFVYGDALFLMLNSNTESIATHDLFIREAVAKNPGAKWRIACFHHSVYSEADHFADPDVIDRRSNFPPVFERYGIDAVLQGHDHSYTRTLPMLKGKPVEGADPKASSVTDPAGVIYFTFNSGSGSKFYDWHDQAPEVFSAVRWQGKVPSFSYLALEGGKLTITTYRTDDMSVVDSFSIVKTK